MKAPESTLHPSFLILHRLHHTPDVSKFRMLHVMTQHLVSVSTRCLNRASCPFCQSQTSKELLDVRLTRLSQFSSGLPATHARCAQRFAGSTASGREALEVLLLVAALPGAYPGLHPSVKADHMASEASANRDRTEYRRSHPACECRSLSNLDPLRRLVRPNLLRHGRRMQAGTETTTSARILSAGPFGPLA